MTRYLFSGHLTPREAAVTASSGLKPSVQAILDLIDTADPTWPAVAAVLSEFAAAGIDLDAAAVTMALKLGKQRWALAAPDVDAEPPPPAFAGSIVYYVRRGNLIKIGTTTSPRSRFGDLLPDEILAVEPGGRPEEIRRHKQFRHIRCRGEYFRYTPELRDHIAAIRASGGEPNPAWPTAAGLGELRGEAWHLPPASSPEKMTAAQAAAKLGIKETRIRGWRARGRLLPAGRDDQRRFLFYVEHLMLLRDSPRTRMSQWT